MFRLTVLGLVVAACAGAAPVISFTQEGFCYPLELPRQNCTNFARYTLETDGKKFKSIGLEASAGIFPIPIAGQQFVEYYTARTAVLEITLWTDGPQIESTIALTINTSGDFGPNFRGDASMSVNGTTGLFCPGGCMNRTLIAPITMGGPFTLRLFAEGAAWSYSPSIGGYGGGAGAFVQDITPLWGNVYVEEVPEPSTFTLLALSIVALRLFHLKLLPSRRAIHRP